VEADETSSMVVESLTM